jgi:peptide/nickel transport system substrate-binding protein
MLGALVFSFLVTVDEHGRLVPDAAVAVPTQENGGISKDGLRITYHLRPGIRWQDGVPLTSADCAFTYEAIENPHNDLPSRAGYDEIRSVTTPDPATVVVTLKAPFSPITDAFLAPDYNYPILPKHLLARYADLNENAFNEHPIGSGPFRVVRWARGDHLTLERNADYFRGEPKTARIEIKFIPSYDTIVQQLQTHEIDAAPALAPFTYPRLERLERTRVVLTPEAGMVAVYFNTKSAVVGDARVRRALIEALDVPALLRDATYGVELPGDPMRGLFGWAYHPEKPPPFDLAGANALLDAAGWHRTASGVREKAGVPLALRYVASTATSAIYATTIQQALARVGADVSIKTFAPQLFFAPGAMGGPVFGGKYDLSVLTIYTGAGDPDTSPYLGCDQIPPSGFNLAAFCDGPLERAQRDDATTFDRARRERDMAVVERRLLDTLPIDVLAQLRQVTAVNDRMRGFSPTPLTPYARTWEWSLSAL